MPDIAVAVVAFPVKAPTNDGAVKAPVLALNVKFVPDFGARFPVAAVVNRTLQDASADSSATVTVVANVAVAAFPVHDAELPVHDPELPETFPVTFPVKLPVTDVVVNIPDDGLYDNPVSVSIPCVPVAPSTNVK